MPGLGQSSGFQLQIVDETGLGGVADRREPDRGVTGRPLRSAGSAERSFRIASSPEQRHMITVNRKTKTARLAVITIENPGGIPGPFVNAQGGDFSSRWSFCASDLMSPLVASRFAESLLTSGAAFLGAGPAVG